MEDLLLLLTRQEVSPLSVNYLLNTVDESFTRRERNQLVRFLRGVSAQSVEKTLTTLVNNQQANTFDSVIDQTTLNTPGQRTRVINEEQTRSAISAASGSRSNLSPPETLNSVVFGTTNSDRRIRAKGAGSFVYAGNGADRITLSKRAVESSIYGGNGSDRIDGSKGRGNLLAGNGGQDVLIGGQDDILRGGGGRDRLIAGEGNDLSGGSGRDTFVIAQDELPDRLNRILDFNQRLDFLAIDDVRGISSIRDIEILQQGRDTLIRADGENIALLVGTSRLSANAISIT